MYLSSIGFLFYHYLWAFARSPSENILTASGDQKTVFCRPTSTLTSKPFAFDMSMADPHLPTANRDVTQENLNTFLAWLKENGAHLEGLSFGAGM
jgi:hypothetical protein